MKIIFATLLLLSLLLSSCFLEVANAYPSYCDSKCKDRCAKAGLQKRCLKYCSICCSQCNCVPSGTYGNKSECPCYASILNSKGQSKCP